MYVYVTYIYIYRSLLCYIIAYYIRLLEMETHEGSRQLLAGTTGKVSNLCRRPTSDTSSEST